uniref:Portal protein n=1 Tax=Pseudomonas phage Touem01 TaxID=3138548 RepID=A0AAU6W1T1_9VIRU
MTDIALEVAHNPNAPRDEQQDAMRIATQEAMPSSVPDMLPLVQFVAEQYQEQEFNKALAKQNVIPFPSRAAETGQIGMQSVWLDDQRTNIQGEWYERPTAFSFDTMRTMADNTPILASVIMTRQRQIKRFCRVSEGGKGPGFQIKLKDQSLKIGTEEQKNIQLLQGFFTNCGWESKPRIRQRMRRDNFSGFMAKQIRDSLIMDSAPIEIEWKRDKAKGIDGFYSVDGSTIRLCNEVGYQGDDEIFALQVLEGRIRAAYTHDDLIYVPRNPRTDVLAGGYGMSETELLIKVVTGFLNAFTYNTKYFDSNAIPKGLLHLTGNYDEADLASFKRQWNGMVKGVNNAWTLPVMVSKNLESRVGFENFNAEVNEIMFGKWMTFLTSIICAIYGMAPDEINFESFTNGHSSLGGKDTEEKLINSKDKGLRPLLSHYEDLFSDYIVGEFGDKYDFRWTGLDEKDPDQIWTEEKTLSTWNEARKSRGQEELTDKLLGNAPLNPDLIGLYMQANMSSQEQNPGDEDSESPGSKSGGGKSKSDVDMQKAFGLPPIFKIEP